MKLRFFVSVAVSLAVGFGVGFVAKGAQERGLRRTAERIEAVLRPALTAGEVQADILAPVLGSAEGLVFGLVLDMDQRPLAGWETQDGAVRREWWRKDRAVRILEAFRSGKDLREEPKGFLVRSFAESGRRVLLVFRRSDTMVPALAAGLTVFLVLSVASVLGGGIPVRTEVVRPSGGTVPEPPDKSDAAPEGTGHMLEKLSFFREVALATNGFTDLGSMLRDLCGVIAAKFPGRNIVFFLQGGGAEEVLRPVKGLVGNRVMDQEDLVAAGYGDVDADEAWRLCGEQEEAERIRIPLRDEETLYGFILLEAREPPEERPDVEELRFVSRQVALAVKNSVLYREAITDGLTGLFVHRYFQIRLEDELRRFRRTGRPFSLFLFDVDHFKRFNDEHGHQAGDFVLRELAATVKGCVRASDLCFRYGGEEMGVVFPETGLEEGLLVAEKVRAVVEGRGFVYGGVALRVTVSGGVAAVWEGATAKDLIEACDRALYRAKAEGRNRVVAAGT